MDIQRVILKSAITVAGIIFIYQASHGIKKHAMERSNSSANQGEKQLNIIKKN